MAFSMLSDELLQAWGREVLPRLGARDLCSLRASCRQLRDLITGHFPEDLPLALPASAHPPVSPLHAAVRVGSRTQAFCEHTGPGGAASGWCPRSRDLTRRASVSAAPGRLLEAAGTDAGGKSGRPPRSRRFAASSRLEQAVCPARPWQRPFSHHNQVRNHISSGECVGQVDDQAGWMLQA